MQAPRSTHRPCRRTARHIHAPQFRRRGLRDPLAIAEGHPQMSTVQERVRQIVVEQLGVKEEEVSPDSSFVDDLGADSLDTVELVMALEEEFNCEIPDEEAEENHHCAGGYRLHHRAHRVVCPLLRHCIERTGVPRRFPKSPAASPWNRPA